MKLEEASCFLQKLCDVPVTILPDKASFENLIYTYQFHSVQNLQISHLYTGFFLGDSQNVFQEVIDPFHIRFIFCTISHIPVAFGPYCTEIFSVSDCSILIKRLKLNGCSAKELAVYRSRFPVMDEGQAQFYVRCLMRQIQPDADPPLELFDCTSVGQNALEHDFAYTPYIELIKKRYVLEQQFMSQIANGNSQEALRSWNSLHKQMAYLKRQLGDTVESARFSATITRTVIRMAAYGAGIPADVLDRLTRNSSDAISRLTSIEAIKQETTRLILQICRIIRRQFDEQYSSLVLSAIYFLEYHYNQEIRIEDLAAELAVSANHLIVRFRTETGITPGAYLIKTRMKKARFLLADNGRTIQEVAEAVGIPDANYFTRLFKRTYGETPSQYRCTCKNM